jgi:hypothetical protein
MTCQRIKLIRHPNAKALHSGAFKSKMYYARFLKSDNFADNSGD